MAAKTIPITNNGLWLILALVAAALAHPATFSAAEFATPSPCSAPEYHQFDFWLGDWDAFDIGSSTPNARVRVVRILDGCVIHEDYQSVAGQKGESFTIYDASRKVWHQTWVTNSGRLLIIEGKRAGDAIILAGADRTTKGHERRIRGIWKPVEGGVRETAFTSIDGGKTWTLWFDLLFRSHK